MTLAASGVAETGVLPVEVLIKLAPLSIQMPAALEISAAFSITPVYRMILEGCFLPVILLIRATKSAQV